MTLRKILLAGVSALALSILTAGPARADPASITLAITAAASNALNALGASVAFQAVAGQVVAALAPLASIAVSVGVNAIANGLLNKPKPTNVQQELKQAIPNRTFHYGRVKVAGQLAFWQSKSLPFGGDRRRTQFKIVLLSAREIDAVEQIYLNDLPVDIDPATNGVTTAPYVIVVRQMVKIATHLGTDNQLADPMMMAAWPGVWTADHRLRGIANLVCAFEAPEGVNQVSEIYPGGEPSVSARLRANKVYDPRKDSTAGGSGAHRIGDPATWEWSENAALCILDWLTHRDGFRIPVARINLASFRAMADLCDEPVALKNGGTEPRYRVATTVDLTEPKAQVLARLKQACDARLYRNRQGEVCIRGGRWVEPSVTIRDQPDDGPGQIREIEYAEVSALDRCNKYKISFLSAPHGYVEQECDPWVDQADIDANGERSQPLDLSHIPSYGQARRLAKIFMARQNAPWLVSLTSNFSGLNAIGEETLRLVHDEEGFDGPFWIEDGPRIAEDFTATTFPLLRAAAPASYDWTAAEEGEPPAIPPELSEYRIPRLDFSQTLNSQYLGV